MKIIKVLIISGIILIILVLIFTLFLEPLLFGQKEQIKQQHATGTITVGFGQNHTYPISSDMFGINDLGFVGIANQVIKYFPNAGFKTMRVFTPVMTTVFQDPRSIHDPTYQNWTNFDAELTILKNNNITPIILLTKTPTPLLPENQHPPQVNPCSTQNLDKYNVRPMYLVPDPKKPGQFLDIGDSEWASAAAQVVAHVDVVFVKQNPTFMPLYEIGNEPDANPYMCIPNTSPAANLQKLSYYNQLFSLAARAMRRQASLDGVTIKIGGPALTKHHLDTWLSGPLSFLHDSQTAPFVDFVSYHDYIMGGNDNNWDGKHSLLDATQDPTTGVEATYRQVSQMVRQGLQPNPASTPIYIDEYNTSTIKGLDCCRIHPQFGPLWNALFVTDLLHSVIDTGTSHGQASILPHIDYWDVTEPVTDPKGAIFCMFGDVAAMNCQPGSDPKPYPQYYLYQLLNDPNYLDLTDGGYVINTTISMPPGLLVTAINSSKKDNILVVNTGATNYTALTVFIQNARFQSPGTVFTLNAANPHITSQSVALAVSQDGNGYNATISIPEYSTVALSMSGRNS